MSYFLGKQNLKKMNVVIEEDKPPVDIEQAQKEVKKGKNDLDSEEIHMSEEDGDRESELLTYIKKNLKMIYDGMRDADVEEVNGCVPRNPVELREKLTETSKRRINSTSTECFLISGVKYEDDNQGKVIVQRKT